MSPLREFIGLIRVKSWRLPLPTGRPANSRLNSLRQRLP